MSTIKYSNRRNLRTSGALAQLFIEEILGDAEVWKDVLGWEGAYAASNWGRVKSLARMKWNGKVMHSSPETILQPGNLCKGKEYLFVNLWRKNKAKLTLVHRLILETFVGPCPDGMEVCHSPDRKASNNRLDNLRWDTKKGNASDKYIHGTDQRGDKHHMSKLSEFEVREIRRLHVTGMYTQRRLAVMFRITFGTINDIVLRRTWSHI